MKSLPITLTFFVLTFFTACLSDQNQDQNTGETETETETTTQAGAVADESVTRLPDSTSTDTLSKEKLAALRSAEAIPLVPETREGTTAFREYTCKGNEPFWNLTIKPAGITWFLMGDQRVRFPYRKPVMEGDAVVFHSANDMHKITIKIWKKPCQDTMADEIYPFTSEINVDGAVFTGCAE